MTKPFKETTLGLWLAKSAPQLLETIGDSFPPAKIITSLIQSVLPDLKPEDKKALDQALSEYTKELEAFSNNQESERTNRLQIDMTSDSWLSKNIRPIILIASFLLFTILILLNSVTWGMKTPIAFLDVLQELLLMAISFYFVDRTINKAILNNKK